jgi:hypothetical protein
MRDKLLFLLPVLAVSFCHAQIPDGIPALPNYDVRTFDVVGNGVAHYPIA